MLACTAEIIDRRKELPHKELGGEDAYLLRLLPHPRTRILEICLRACRELPKLLYLLLQPLHFSLKNCRIWYRWRRR